MLQNDISELTNNPNVDLDGSNTAYTIFMIIGIIGYFTIPTVAGWIIQAGGMGSYNRSINNTAMTGGSWAGSIAGVTECSALTKEQNKAADVQKHQNNAKISKS